jgi:hypothetical protein
MNEAGVKESGLQLLRGLFLTAMLDARAMLRRRGAVFAIVTVALTAVAMLTATPKDAIHVKSIVDLFGGSVLVLLVFAETMRIARPDYRLDTGRVARLAWFTLLLIGILVVCFVIGLVPFAVLRAFTAPNGSLHDWDAVPTIVLDVVSALVTARFAFVCFLCEENGMRAFSFSWRLTAGPSFLPTLLVSIAYVLPFTIVANLFDRLQSAGPLVFVEGARVFAYLILSFGAASFVNPLLLRWMMACERIHPDAYVGFNEAVASQPSLDANLV